MPRLERGIRYLREKETMPPARVLVVDDSVVVRKFVCDALSASAEVEVAGTAPSGAIALAKIPQLNPDVITLDIEMPGLDGIQTLVEIKKLYPKLPVIMFSSLTERGAAITLEALSLGASDYATKPTNSASLASSMEQVRQELVSKIISLVGRSAPVVPRRVLPTLARTAFVCQKIDIVAIGTSTGGPNALAAVIPRLAENFPVPIVVVQHMPPVFTRLLSERLNKLAAVGVHEGEAGRVLDPGHVWIAPGGHHMTVARKGRDVVLAMNDDAPENYCRPAVDALFRSVAQVYGPNVLAVVLTGMGADGLRGSQWIREKGGDVIAQDEATSVVWGMPGAVVNAGQAREVYPIEAMAAEIGRRVNTDERLAKNNRAASQPGIR
jgi:two-component system, chemotaxis family, protein-glutamate methylesterase/glutaminase